MRKIIDRKNQTSDIGERRASARKTGDPEYLQRRAELLRAAARIFKMKGFSAASINDIAREVGIDRASLYYYTSGKEELFHEVIREATIDNVLMVERMQAGDGSPSQKLRAFIVELMASYERHYPYMYVYIQEDMTQIADNRTGWGREMNKLAKRFDEAVIGIVKRGFEDGSFAPGIGTPRLIAYGIIGMCNWSHRWFRPGRGDKGEVVGTAFADMVLAGLQSGDARTTPSTLRQETKPAAAV